MSEITSHAESANGIVKDSPAKSIDDLQKGVEDVNEDYDDDEEEEEGAYEVCRGLCNAGFMVIERSLC